MEININIIPPYRKEEIKKTKKTKLVLRLELGITMIILVFVGFLFSLSYILDINYNIVSNNAEAEKNRDQYEKISSYEKEFESVNAEVSDILLLKKDQLYWSNLLFELDKAVFGGIDITDLSTKEYAIFLVGKADSRDSLMKFKEKLENSGCFYEVNLPLSNLVSKDNIDFQMDFKVREECIHSKAK
jgi:Tfp pilus assembly protein PilN